MQFTKINKLVFITIFLVLILFGYFFYKKTINNLGEYSINFIKQINQNDVFFDFKKIDIGIEKFTLYFIVDNFKLYVEQYGNNQQIFNAKQLKIKFGIRQIIRFFFKKSLIIDHLTLVEPNFLIDSNFNFQDIINIFNEKLVSGKNFGIKIQKGYLNIFDSQKNFQYEVKNINGDFNLLNNIEFSLNFEVEINNKKNFINSIISKKVFQKIYQVKFLFSNEYNNLSYNANFTLDEELKNIQKLDGEINVVGSNFLNLFGILCGNCIDENCQIDISNNNLNNFSLKVSNFFDSSNSLVYFKDIIFQQGKNNITGEVVWDNKQNKLINNLIVKEFAIDDLFLNTDTSSLMQKSKLKIEEVKNIYDHISKKINFLREFLSFLEKVDSDNYVSIENIVIQNKVFFRDIICKFQTRENGIIFNELQSNIDSQYILKVNSVKDSKNLQISIADSEKVFTMFDFDYLLKSLIAKDFVFQNKESKIFGDFEIKFHPKSNLSRGKIIIENFNLNNQLISDVLSGLSFNNNHYVYLINKTLILIAKYNLFYDLDIQFNNLIFDNELVNKIFIKLLIEGGQINISSDANSNLFKNLKLSSKMFYNNFIPKLDIACEVDALSLEDIDFIEWIKERIFLNESEFRKNQDKTIWKNYDFNFEKLKDLEMNIIFSVKKVIFLNNYINSLQFKISSKDNIYNFSTAFSGSDDKSNFINDLQINLNNNFINANFYGKQISWLNQGLGYIDGFIENQNKNHSKIDFVGKFNTSGTSIMKILDNLNFNIRYNIYNLLINQFDFNGFIKNFSDAKANQKLISLSEQSVISGQTMINLLKGEAQIKSGLIESNFEIFANNFNGSGAFNMFLHNSVFRALTRMAFFANNSVSSSISYVDVKWNGNMYNINKNIDQELSK